MNTRRVQPEQFIHFAGEEPTDFSGLEAMAEESYSERRLYAWIALILAWIAVGVIVWYF